MNRQRPSKVIADVTFAENPAAALAAKKQSCPATARSWKKGSDDQSWTAMDNNPLASMRQIRCNPSPSESLSKLLKTAVPEVKQNTECFLCDMMDCVMATTPARFLLGSSHLMRGWDMA